MSPLEGIRIRAGDERDADAAFRVWQASLTERRGRPPKREGSGRVRERLRSLDTWVMLVAEADDRVVGMAMATQARAEEGVGDAVPGLCHVSLVLVAPERWREGIGGALMDAILIDACERGYQRVQLWVHEDNVPAQRLYAGRGFEPTDHVKPDDEGDIIRRWHRRLGR